MKNKLGEIEEIYEDKGLRSRMNILGGRFRFKLDEGKEFKEIEEGVRRFKFGMSVNIGGSMRIRGSMMRFRFKMSKCKCTERGE
jgi:hypothetical protein